jgi:hypothetical protein
MPSNVSNVTEPMRYILPLLLLLMSCSQAKRAQYHYKRALANGLKIEQGSDTIRVATIDSIPVIKNDTIVWEKYIAYRDTVIMYRTVTLPKTKWQTRVEMRERIKIEKIKGDTIVKKAKAEQKVTYITRWWPFWLGLAIPFVRRLAWSAIMSKLNR